MSKFIKAAIYVAASLLLYFLLREALPKYREALGVYLALFLFDGYLWMSTGPYLRKRGILVHLLGGLFYWLPFLLILASGIYGWFVPFPSWNTILRTEVTTFILIGYGIKVIPVITRVISDIIRLLFGKPRTPSIYGRKPVEPKNMLMITGWVLGAALGILLIAGHFAGQYRFQVNQVKLTIKDLPPSFENFRIVQISDLHLGNWNCPHKLDEAVTRINNLRPDAIFVTGDAATFSSLDVIRFKSSLKKLKAREGIYVIYGNHDYGQYYKVKSRQEVYDNMKRFGEFYHELGWMLLCNEEKIIARGTDSIAVIGVENWGEEKRFPKLADLIKAEKGTEKIATKLLLSHDPSYWEKYITKYHPEVDVTFSGHSHGGQVGLELPGLRFSLVSGMHPYWAGLYTDTTEQGKVQYLYVNRGLGTVGYNGRVGIMPEITLFTLSRDTIH